MWRASLCALAASLSWGANCSRTSAGLTPFTDPFPSAYQKKPLSLYPQGNTRPPDFDLLGRQQAARVVPRDTSGNPDANGKIVFLSVGTSEFSEFVGLAASDALSDPRVQAVDGAVSDWNAAAVVQQPNQYWSLVAARLQAAGATAPQVQVVWMEEADPNTTQPFPDHAVQLQAELQAIILDARNRFPNLRIVYLSSRSYAGYSGAPSGGEPLAYESGFAVKWLIERQISGAPELDPAAGKAPWMAWGPYLWADGATQRFDGLSWNCADFQSTGIDPAASGRNTVARMLLDFLHTDTTARPWYLSQPLPTPTPAVAVVVNSAGYGKTVATGSIATIFGSNLSGGSAAAAVFPLPHELLGTRVEIDGTPALLYYVSPTQINFVVPAEGGSTLSVVRGSTAGAKVGPGIAFWAPGLFTLDSTPGGPAAAEHSDGTVISAANPARRGETIQIFGTGVGYVNPLLAIPVPVPVVQFGGQAGRVTYAGPAPGIPGVTQINVIVPLAAPTGNAVELSFQLGIAGSNAAVIAIGAN